MSVKNFFLLALCLLSSGLLANAQNTFRVVGSPKVDNTVMPQVEWSVEVLDKGPYKKSAEFTLRFTAEVIVKDWHLYSAQPSDEFSYMPTEFYLDPNTSRSIELVGGMKDESEPIEETDEIMGGMIRFFDVHTVSFSQTFKVTGKNPKIQGEINGQLCKAPENGGQCIRLRVPVEWTLPAQ